MKVTCLPLGPVCANCYIFSDGSGNGAVVDPGEYNFGLQLAIENAGIKSLQYILCTHSHFDHVSGVAQLKERYPEAQVVCGAEDAPALSSPVLSLAESFGLPFNPCYADKPVKNGDELSVGGLKVKVLGAPGHSPGGVVYYLPQEGVMFTGDTLFKRSIGRTDLYGGDYSVLLKTLGKFKDYPAETVVYSGHGEKTSIDYELKYNPYIR
ncbi:MAG: MBL fold metallo-hydrolase [Clostridia bacterium]|nr:MBL fold metallo-hydrolase [Clostridia bacterium]